MRREAVVGLALVVGLGGCEGDAPRESGSGGSASSTGVMATTTSVTSSVSVGGGDGDGNDFPAQAIALDVGKVHGAVLERVDDVDYYRVEIAERGLYAFEVDAQPDDDPFAPGYIDAVVTLYTIQFDVNLRYAENDDPWPRTTQDSELITELVPGSYLLRVADHCNWRELEQDDPCPEPVVFANPSYVVSARRWTTNRLGLVGEGEAPVVTFDPEPAVPERYTPTVVWGGFSGINTYALTMPADWIVTTSGGERPQWQVVTFPAGNRGSGSSVETGRVWLSDRVDPSDPTATVLGAVDASLEAGTQLLVPATGASGVPGGSFGQTDPVFVHVSPAASMLGGRPFYLLRVAGASTAPWESEPNDTASSAPSLPGAGLSYAVGGELPTGDEDWFGLDLVSEGIPINYFVDARCVAQGRGSGLEGLTVELVEADGVSVAFEGVETANGPARAGGGPVPLPVGSPQLYVHVTRQTQAVDNDAVYYHCDLRFLAP